MKNMFKATMVVFVSLIFLVTAASAKEIGVTDKSVKIGFLTVLTGPAAGIGRLIGQGAEIAFKEANDAGGVHGRKIDLILEDNAYNPKQTVAGIKKLKNRDKIFGIAGCIGAAPGLAAVPLAQANKIPTFLSGGLKTWFVPPKRYVFVVGMPYRLEMIGLTEYAMKNLAASKKKFGFLFQDDSKEACMGASEAISAKYGINVVTHQSFKRRTPDPSPQILALKKAGVEVVLVLTNARDMALILKKTMELNYKPTYMGITPSIDPSIFKALPPGDIDFYATAALAPLSMEIPGIRHLNELGNKYYPKFHLATYQLLGYVPGRIFVNTLKMAGRDLTREKFVQAAEKTKNLDLQGLAPPVTFSATRRYSASSVMIVKMDTAAKTFKVVRGSEEVKCNPFKK